MRSPYKLPVREYAGGGRGIRHLITWFHYA